MKFVHGDIPFGQRSETVEEINDDGRYADGDQAGDIDVDLLFGMPDEIEEPTQHELESRAAMAGWERIRNDLIDVVTEDAAMPVGQVCTVPFSP